MRRFYLWCAIALPLCAQPPAVFEELTIEYRLETDRLVETRSGILRLDSATLAPSLRLIVLPRLNARGAATLKEAVILRRDTATPASPLMQSQRTTFSWAIDDAQAGDRIRFATEQPVDLTANAAGEWWYANSATIPLPVESGSVRLVLPTGFTGSVRVVDAVNSGTRQEWSLAGSTATTIAARFTVSSFASWSEFRAWTQAQCPVTRSVGIPAAGTPVEIAEALAARLAVNRPNQPPCRAPDAVLESGVASPLEAATLFASALLSRGIAAESLLVSRDDAPEAVDPTVLNGAFVHVGELWFDASDLGHGEGVRLTAGTESALPLRAADANWISPLVAHGALHLQPGRMDATVDAELLSSGTLLGTVSVVLEGSADDRQAFASFLADRRVGATPESTQTPDQFTRRIVMREDAFVLPIERTKETALNTLPLVSEPVRLSDGGLYLGAPGAYREHIELAPSDTRRVRADIRLNVDRPFARYRSEATEVDGRVVITRELEVRSAYVPAEDANQARGLFGQIRADQQRTFALQRSGRVDWKTWVDSVPPHQLNDLAYKAYFPNAEYEAALLMLERATQLNTRDAYAWGLLASVQTVLGRNHAALDARAKQIEIDPRNTGTRQAFEVLQMALEPEQAIQEARAQLEVNSNDANAWGRLQGASVTLKKWADAEAAATRGIELRMPAPPSPITLQAIANYQACQGKLEDPKAAINEALGQMRAPNILNLTIMTLNDCERHMEVADAFCDEFLRLMEPFVPSTTSDLLSLVAFPQTFASGLYQCGLVHIRLGKIDSGLDRVRAAARILPSTSIHQPARALWASNQREEAEALWIEVCQIYPELIDQVPEEIRDRVRSANTGIIFPGWIPVPAATSQVERTVELGDELFFIVRADGTGTATRVFDLNREQAPRVQAALRGMKVPIVAFDGRAIPSVHIVMVRNFEGKAEVFRSFAGPVIRMVQSIRQDLFRPPQAARPQ